MKPYRSAGKKATSREADTGKTLQTFQVNTTNKVMIGEIKSLKNKL